MSAASEVVLAKAAEVPMMMVASSWFMRISSPSEVDAGRNAGR
jgi:hypothetical protein